MSRRLTKSQRGQVGETARTAYEIAEARSHRNGDFSDGIKQYEDSDTLFNHSKIVSDGMRIRVITPAEDAGTKKAITKYDWQRTLAVARQIYSRVGEVSGAIDQKATYAVGNSWLPKYIGANKAWGEAAAEWLRFGWYPHACLRGEPFDFNMALRMDSIHFDRDGDHTFRYVLDDEGFPKLDFVPSHQITTRYGWAIDEFEPVVSGRFEGALMYNGVIFNRNKQVIGYQVVGESESQDVQLSTNEAQMLYEPIFCDQGRGIAPIGKTLLSWMDFEDIQHFLKRQVKQDSAQGIMHYNELGVPESSKSFYDKSKTGNMADVTVEELEGNEVMYFKAQGGGRLAPYKSDRPSPNVTDYTQRILRGCYLALGWYYELTDPQVIGGASTRLIQNGARLKVIERQVTLKKRAMRCVAWALSVAMERGDIPRNEDMRGAIPDFMSWDFSLPILLTVDARYDEKTELEQLKQGALTYRDYFAKRSQDWVEQFEQQKLEDDKKKELGIKKEPVPVDPAKTNNEEALNDDERANQSL